MEGGDIVKGILLLSHGRLCEGMMDSLQMLGMDTTKVAAMPLYIDSELDDYTKQLSDLIDALDDGDGVLVITDIVSGTPFNRCCLLYDKKNIEVITGLSLPMVVSAITSRDMYSLEKLGENCISEAKTCMVSVRSILQ